MNAGRAAVIVGGARLPFAKQNTAYATESVPALGTACVRHVVERFALKRQAVGEIAFGAVIKHARDWNLARDVALGSGLAATTPGLTLARACGTGLDAVLHIAGRIALGQIESGIAGGADSTSEVPLVLDPRLNARLLAVARAKGGLAKAKALVSGFSFSELRPETPAVREARTGKSMGEHCEEMAKAWRISRADQDQLALRSHQRAAQAYARGFFDDHVQPHLGLTRDGLVRADSTIEKLASLPPAFDRRSGYGSLTAGNSSALSDGASAVLLSSQARADKAGWPVLARVVDARIAAVDFQAGDGLLMAPVRAIAELLHANQLALSDIDVFEIHEAFAAQVLCTLRALENLEYCREKLGLTAPLGSIDPDKLNLVGSSLAVGHPFAATGARVVLTAAKLLSERGSGRALVSVCTAGGMGVVALLER